MSEETVLEPEQTEVIAPMSIEELLSFAVQDAIGGQSAEPLADTFFDEFVNQNREETPQILMLLDLPNEAIIEMLVQSQLQAIEMLKQNAPKFLNDLRSSVASRLAAMTTQTAQGNKK